MFKENLDPSDCLDIETVVIVVVDDFDKIQTLKLYNPSRKPSTSRKRCQEVAPKNAEKVCTGRPSPCHPMKFAHILCAEAVQFWR